MIRSLPLAVLTKLDTLLTLTKNRVQEILTSAARCRIAVLGDEGTLLAEQAGPNPTDDGVVIASRKGAPLAALTTPPQYTLPKDARDHRLMAFRMLVRDFSKAIAEGHSPSPSFTDGWRCQQVLDAVRESSDAGRTVKLA